MHFILMYEVFWGFLEFIFSSVWVSESSISDELLRCFAKKPLSIAFVCSGARFQLSTLNRLPFPSIKLLRHSGGLEGRVRCEILDRQQRFQEFRPRATGRPGDRLRDRDRLSNQHT